jgi:two-component system response regulator
MSASHKEFIMSGLVDILLVEDNPTDRELALRALRKHHLTEAIHVVQDGAEALEFLFATGAYAHRQKANRPRVVLLDLKLPKVDGLEVLQRVRADPHLRTTPVVMLTSSREERDVVESYRLGVNSFVVKPVDFDQFTETVQRVGGYWLQLNQSPSV